MPSSGFTPGNGGGKPAAPLAPDPAIEEYNQRQEERLGLNTPSQNRLQPLINTPPSTSVTAPAQPQSDTGRDRADKKKKSHKPASSGQSRSGFPQAYMHVSNDAQLRLLMRNDDKRFSPENSAGPLSGKLAPLRPVKVESHDGTTTRRLFSGWVQSIHPAANQNGERAATIRVAGAMQFLKATETKIELQENQRSDQIIDALVQEVIFPPALADAWVLGDPDYSKLGQSTTLADLRAYSDFDEGLLTVQMAGDNWVRQGGYSDQEKDTFDVYRGIRDVTAAERGKFFFDRAGKAVFWNRHHILDKDAVDATIDDAMTDMKYSFASLDQTKNEIIVTCHPLSPLLEAYFD